MSLFLVTLFVNIVLSYFIGFRYKNSLSEVLSPEIYYQVVVFISLTLPMVISYFYKCISKQFLVLKIKTLKNKNIDITKFDEAIKEMYQEIVEQDIPTQQQIKEMHEALKRQFK